MTTEGESTPLLHDAERLQQKTASADEIPIQALALSMARKNLTPFELRLMGLDAERNISERKDEEALDQYIFQHCGPLMGRPKWGRLELPHLARAVAALLWLLVLTRPPSQKKIMKQTAAQQTSREKMRQELTERLATAFERAVALVVAWEEMPPENVVFGSESEDSDVLVQLLLERMRFDDTPGTMTSVADLLLQMCLLPKSACLSRVTCHPGLRAAAENVWQRRVPVGRCRGFKSNTIFQVYRLGWWLFTLASLIIALSPAASYYAALNPLLERWESHHAHKHPFKMALWIVWLPTAFGWFAELIRTLVLGPLPLTRLRSLPLPAGSYTPLVAHSFISGFAVLRLLSFGHQPMASVAYILLAWSVPFQLLSLFVLPAGLPTLAPAFNKPAIIRFKALRVLNDRIAAFRPFFIFFTISLACLVWAVNGEVDLDPGKYGSSARWKAAAIDDHGQRTASPIEVRSSLAAGILFVALIAWLAGDAIASTASPTERAADIAEHAVMEHLRYVRLFTPAKDEAPPLPPPFNLLFLLPRAVGWALSFVDQNGEAVNQDPPSTARRVVCRVRRGAQTAAWLLLWPHLWTVEKLFSFFT